ncbi:LytR/AlgR family response regulator transcription factor [Ancylomarina longa]|uniref:DNA-binding response regulator n=1 Tax=Ancylomarina longa TaxID=2487017 RepID=A0A434AZ84_9BACT|nr:LytTR family DNA-binding domain-containing protein [Ancylomarina longa]RUT79932.1 DNA-binding response regulator [Ancylomarina longa]
MKLKCLIVDDEALALDVLEEYISRLDHLELVERCENPVQAFEILQSCEVDLLFVDIQMPHLNGLELIRNLSHPPKIILTTAYREYALDGFELNVSDYLLKPISFERFLKSIGRVVPSFDSAPSVQNNSEEEFLYLKVDKKMVKILLRDILFVESMGSYVKVITADKKHVCYKRISEFEEKLKSYGFYRVHRSFLVATKHIDSYSASVIEISGHEIPIGRNYKNDFIGEMRKLNTIGI